MLGLLTVLCPEHGMVPCCAAGTQEYDDGDFPGPKAWPAGMALISFFALAAFAQALYVGSTSPDL
jgi:hypothetical protein